MTVFPKVEVVTVGAGWTAGIIAQQLTEQGKDSHAIAQAMADLAHAAAAADRYRVGGDFARCARGWQAAWRCGSSPHADFSPR